MKIRKIVTAFALVACIAGCCSCAKGKDGDVMEEWTGGKVAVSEYAQTYRLEEGMLVNPPTVVCDVTSQATLDAMRAATWTPSNAVFRFSKNYNVLSADGKKLDSFANIYDNICKGKIIPVLYLENTECADAAIAFLTERMEIADLAVMSSRPEVVKKVRTAFPKIRGILSYDALQSPEGVAQTANEALAATVVLPQSAASAETVRYIQARFKTVWVKAESAGDLDLYDCLGSGAYGLMCSEYGKAYSLIADCAKGVLRTPFNAAHRGLPATHHENSVSGTVAAAAAGATHIELDGYLSKDNHIVMMHNPDISATTNGMGKVEEMTLEEIRQYKLNRKGAEEDIPTLPEIIDAMQNSDSVLIFESKSGNNAIIDELKKVVEEKHFEDRIVVISFAENIIRKMVTTLPNIPTALLANNMTEGSIERWTALNTGIDVNSAVMTEEFEHFYKDRGMIGWYWTFDTAGQTIDTADLGYVGLTNNAADQFVSANGEEAIMLVKPLASYAATGALEEGSKIDLTGVTYKGNEVTVKGTVRFVAEKNGKYAVVATCDTKKDSAVYAPRLYTQVFYIDKE